MRGVEGDVVAEAVLGGECVLLMAGNALADAAIGVDCRGDAVVGVAKNPAAIFDGTHARHVEMLPGRAGIAVPGVVADVDENFGAELGEVADFVGEDCFVADEDAVAMAVKAEDFSLIAAIEF